MQHGNLPAAACHPTLHMSSLWHLTNAEPMGESTCCWVNSSFNLYTHSLQQILCLALTNSFLLLSTGLTPLECDVHKSKTQ